MGHCGSATFKINVCSINSAQYTMKVLITAPKKSGLALPLKLKAPVLISLTVLRAISGMNDIIQCQVALTLEWLAIAC